jgi:two-component system sensor histidine kinase/response regulator
MNDKTSSGTILIVDDQPDNLKVLLTLLRNKNFNVLLAGDGEESIQVTEHAHPDLILLDIMMPGGISGFEVCKRLKSAETTRDIPIIFMTALTDTVNKINGFKLGAADYITKPFQHEELLARINAHLSIRKLQQELTQQNQLLKKEVERSQKLEAAHQKTHLLLEQTLKSRGSSSGTDELEKCQTELNKCHTELDTLAHAVTHDLKNPLTTIITLSQQLGKNSSQNRLQRLDAQSTKALQLLSEAGQLAANLVDNLHVLVSRQEAVELELLEMSDIVTFVIEKRLAPMIKQYQAKIKLAEIWPSVPGYEPWLKEIWINYISNGLKYGGKPPHLELGATPHQHEMVRFWIRDNGQGLTPKEQAKLFTPQSPQHQVGIKEHGLGLPMVQQLVEKMGGQVGVESTKGQGCLFYFTLPAYK